MLMPSRASFRAQEATSSRTLQLVAGMFEKASIRTPTLPVVPKSYDDQSMRPPNTRIGERACVCGETCICAFLAKLRFGPETEYAFVGTEFLLPDERERFLAGQGLPERRKKCLLCMRYFQHYNYLSARTNPDFRVGGPVQLQAFENAVLEGVEAPPDPAADASADADLPTHTSPVASKARLPAVGDALCRRAVDGHARGARESPRRADVETGGQVLVAALPVPARRGKQHAVHCAGGRGSRHRRRRVVQAVFWDAPDADGRGGGGKPFGHPTSLQPRLLSFADAGTEAALARLSRMAGDAWTAHAERGWLLAGSVAEATARCALHEELRSASVRAGARRGAGQRGAHGAR